MLHRHCCPVNFSALSTTLALLVSPYIHAIRDMKWKPLPETRCKYLHVRSDAASMRHTVSGNGFHSISLTVNGTAVLRRCNYFLLFATLTLVLSACSGEPETGPVEVRWDQNNCERCRMMLSDPHFAAQIRYFPEAKRSRVVKFDDIGCATLWLKDQPWKNDPETQIWVADFRSGEWIDARKATYIRKNNSPMGYDLGAQVEVDPDGLNFTGARQHIEEIEKKFNVHGKQHQHMPMQHQNLQPMKDQSRDLKQQGLARESAKQ